MITTWGPSPSPAAPDFSEEPVGRPEKDSHRIGQFVRLYSAFIVADKVEVFSRRAGFDAMAACTGLPWRGRLKSPRACTARIVLHLKAGEDGSADGWRLRTSSRSTPTIALPIERLGEQTVAEGEEAPGGRAETVNRASALWTRPLEISDEEYQEFANIGHDYENLLELEPQQG